jgi:hypothetical protein
MCGRIRTTAVAFALMSLTMAGVPAVLGNWAETWDGAQPDLNWVFYCYPDISKTFTQTIKVGTGGNKYISLDETNSVGSDPPATGSAFAIGFGSSEQFADVRIGAVVNVVGDASHRYHGLGARASYFIDKTGASGAPGVVVTKGYIMHINWEGGPAANLSIDIEKVINMQNIMRTDFDVAVPGLGHARSYYAELDVVGSGPAYVTGSLYEYKGGPLVARTNTMVDTAGNDPWEDPAINDAVIASGLSGIFAQNEHEQPAGFHTTFDSVSSLSDGPAAVCLGPADGATGMSVDADLSWVEATFSKSRQLRLGKKGNMKLVEPAPTTAKYDPGVLEFGQTYEWRVDEVGTGGTTVTGKVWSFTTAPCAALDDFESYANNTAIETVWPHNILPEGAYHYVFLETSKVHSGVKAMRFEYQNQATPFFTLTSRTFEQPRDWSGNRNGLSLFFRGEPNNVDQVMYIELQDATGNKAKVEHPYTYACQADTWYEWNIALQRFATGGVNLAAVKKLSIGMGNGTNSGQPVDDVDTIYIDDLSLCPARCFNSGQLDLRADANGDCVIDFEDFAVMAAGWLNDGLSAEP